jgi:hypothetical protein
MRPSRSGASSPTLLLLACVLTGCGHVQPAASAEQHVRAQSPMRVLVYFNQATVATPKLSAAIAEACRCQPHYLQQYRPDTLIYEVSLPQGYEFASFADALMKKGAQLGLRLLEQDRVMQHQ